METLTSVAEIMSTPALTVRPAARLEEAALTLREFHISGLPVVGEDGRLVGILSERDIYRTLARSAGIGTPRGLLDLVLASRPAKGRSLLDQCRDRLRRGRVREIMTRRVVTIAPDATPKDAAELMARASVDRLPVVGPGGRVVGLLTKSDLATLARGRGRSRRGRLHPGGRRSARGRRPPDPFADI